MSYIDNNKDSQSHFFEQNHAMLQANNQEQNMQEHNTTTLRKLYYHTNKSLIASLFCPS
jgi:hypothetical protein